MTCFNTSVHSNHDTIFHVSSGNGGCCDCGDSEAWVCEIGCTVHSNNGSQIGLSDVLFLCFMFVGFPKGD